MSKSRKRKNKGKSLEQKAFETLSKQVQQLEEPIRAETLKKNHVKSNYQDKLQKSVICFKLKNGKVLNGTCINFDDPKIPKTKLFFPAGKNKTNGNSKNLCIPSPIDSRIQGGEIALMEDMNDFLKDIHEQALSEFPEWLEKWGCRANENNPLLNLDEIREEWRYKKRQFGIFRIAAQAGFFTDYRPLSAERLEIIKIEINSLS
jgi:hypothetical protein